MEFNVMVEEIINDYSKKYSISQKNLEIPEPCSEFRRFFWGSSIKLDLLKKEMEFLELFDENYFVDYMKVIDVYSEVLKRGYKETNKFSEYMKNKDKEFKKNYDKLSSLKKKEIPYDFYVSQNVRRAELDYYANHNK